MKDSTFGKLMSSIVIVVFVIPICICVGQIFYTLNKRDSEWKQLRSNVYEAAWYVCHEKMYPSWRYLGSQCFKDYHYKDNFVYCKCLYMGEDRDDLWRDIIIYKDDNGKWR